ncbi:hypothetical protein GXW82_09400 [Streptacidiphilus sp. 4-A2]|nr:hypothetical protein [Streptacidiphilus sp. 4-A2]
MSGWDAAHYPLRLIAGLAGRRLLLRLEYRPDLYSETVVRSVLDQVVRLLEAVAERPGSALDALPAFRAGERAALRVPVAADADRAPARPAATGAEAGSAEARGGRTAGQEPVRELGPGRRSSAASSPRCWGGRRWRRTTTSSPSADSRCPR